MSQFLVIAQPSPSLFQWLIPKATIVVDSRFMELRKTNDLKTLNRLLINATLDSSNKAEISNLVKQGELIPLKTLADKQAGQGFTPPKALAFIRSGAENLIYNAPRYYHFGESLMRKALAIYEHQADSQEVALLREEIETFTRYPHIVLYSSGGMQMAVQAQRALATFLPQYKFLYAYLQFDSKGLVASSHLLMNDGSSELASLNKPIASIDADDDDEDDDYQPNNPVSDPTLPDQLAQSAVGGYAPLSHPLDNLLARLYNERQNALKPLSDEISSLLDSESKTVVPDFASKLKSLQEQYAALANVYQTKIVSAIALISLVTADEKSLVQNDHAHQHAKQPVTIPAQPEPLPDNPEIDKNHPLYFRLMALYNARQQTLKPISDEMIALMDAQNSQSHSNYAEKIEELERKYEKLASDLQKRIIKSVSNLHREYASMPLVQFMSYVKAAGLESLVQENIRLQSQTSGASQISSEQLQSQVEKVRNAKDLKELDGKVAEINKMLSLEKVPDAALLNMYQNTVHSEVSKKLDSFLLTPDKRLAAEELNDKNRVVLVRILRSAWVTDPDEIDYYLNEFDLLTQQHK